jgi:hypothetical protein
VLPYEPPSVITTVAVDRLNAMLAWLRLAALACKSQLTEAEADQMAEESKASW